MATEVEGDQVISGREAKRDGEGSRVEEMKGEAVTN